MALMPLQAAPRKCHCKLLPTQKFLAGLCSSGRADNDNKGGGCGVEKGSAKPGLDPQLPPREPGVDCAVATVAADHSAPILARGLCRERDPGPVSFPFLAEGHKSNPDGTLLLL